MNSITRTPLRVRHATRIRLVQVTHVEQLSPRMRRVVLGGEALDGFVSAAADDHVKLFFPAPGEDKPVLPALGPDGPVFPEGAARPVARNYTPRRFDAASRELTIEFVLHGDGPAAAWSAQARPGSWLGVGGPRGSFLVSEDFSTYLLVGDESALPAIARRLEEIGPGVRAIALIEIADRNEERHLPSAGNVSIIWRHRNGVRPGTGTLLQDALKSIDMPSQDTHAWLAGETDTVRRLRAHLIDEREFPPHHVHAAAYWSRVIEGAG
jgi:NADPH-dependent ferric siderophore reductase